MSLVKTDDAQSYFGGWTLKVYQHPGRRDGVFLTEKQAENFVARIGEICEKYPANLFNVPSERTPRCNGFVHLCETIHRGAEANDVLRSL